VTLLVQVAIAPGRQSSPTAPLITPPCPVPRPLLPFRTLLPSMHLQPPSRKAGEAVGGPIEPPGLVLGGQQRLNHLVIGTKGNGALMVRG
jgi:hypothetical protein